MWARRSWGLAQARPMRTQARPSLGLATSSAQPMRGLAQVTWRPRRPSSSWAAGPRRPKRRLRPLGRSSTGPCPREHRRVLSPTRAQKPCRRGARAPRRRRRCRRRRPRCRRRSPRRRRRSSTPDRREGRRGGSGTGREAGQRVVRSCAGRGWRREQRLEGVGSLSPPSVLISLLFYGINVIGAVQNSDDSGHQPLLPLLPLANC